MRHPPQVLDSATGGTDPVGPLALACQRRYRRQRVSRRRVLVCMPAHGSDAETLLQLKALAALRHPHILPIQGWGTQEGIPDILTPVPSADSLSAALVEGRVSGSAAIEILSVIARAVDFAHEQGVLHGCLEPAAIVLNRDGRPLVADFGLPILVAAVRPPAGVCYSDSAFVAPERLLGQGSDRASDVYAFAAVVYQLLTGEAPFAGDANTADKVYALVNSDPARPSSLDPAIPHAVDEVVMGGLARDPAWRWQSCTAMLEALEWALAGPAPAVAPEVTFPIGEAPGTPETVADVPPNWAPTQPERASVSARGASPGAERRRSHHRFAKALGVATLCALSVIGGAMFGQSGQPGSQDIVRLPSIPQNLPATLVQRLSPTEPGGAAGTARPTAAGSPPATHAKTPPPGTGTAATSAPAQSAPPAAAPPQATGPPPAATAQALSVMVSPARANRGGVVNVAGSGFTAGQMFTVNLTQSGTDYQLQPATQVQANGRFSVSVIIPGQASPGAATISACSVSSNGATGACAQQQITVV